MFGPVCFFVARLFACFVLVDRGTQIKSFAYVCFLAGLIFCFCWCLALVFLFTL